MKIQILPVFHCAGMNEIRKTFSTLTSFLEYPPECIIQSLNQSKEFSALA